LRQHPIHDLLVIIVFQILENATSDKHHTIVLGGGLAGLSAAFFLDNDALVLEKEPFTGGLSRSFRQEGFVFDIGGHAVHSTQKKWHDLLDSLGIELFSQERKAFVDTPSGPIPFPFQYHLAHLPEPVYKECMEGLENHPPVHEGRMHYLAWLHATFGPGICRHFMVPYNKKIWKTDLERLTTEFASQRVPAQERQRLIEINRRPWPSYSQRVAYPVEGGIQAVPDAFRARIDRVRCNAEVTAVNCSDRSVTVRGGETFYYDHLISTIPLPRLLEIVQDLPVDLRMLVPEFDWFPIVAVNLGLKLDRLTEKQRLYVADPSILFHKVVFNMNSAPDCVPQGHSSVSVEITLRRGENPDQETLVGRTIEQLIRLHILSESDPIVFKQVVACEFGYVLYNPRRTELVDACRRHFQPLNVHLCGRFGGWSYQNMDAVVEEARKTAVRIRAHAG
jgi:protoporphyrinogen oxidase